MRRKAGLLAALWLAAGFGAAGASAATPAGCATAPRAGDRTLQLTVGGATRSALVHVPHGVTAGTRVPLVLAFHGFGGTGPKMARYSGFSSIADRQRFVVAYPSSLGLKWNIDAAPALPDDVAFARRLIASVELHACIDPARVFATGVSNGGGMVALLGCELSSELAAIAPVAGAYTGQPVCDPARPVSVLEIHGTADQVAPYFGRRGAPRTADGVPPFVNGWVTRDRCGSVASVSSIAIRTKLFSWTGCAAGATVQHIQIRAGKHQWPGAHPPDPGPPATFCASCVIWRFFAGVVQESPR